MKNYSKEFWIKKHHITIGTHWDDWSLPLRVRWNKWKSRMNDYYSIDIFTDILCFSLIVEIFRGDI